MAAPAIICWYLSCLLAFYKFTICIIFVVVQGFFYSLMASKSTLLSYIIIFLFFCFLRIEILPPSPYCLGGENGCISAMASGLKKTLNRKFLLSDFKRDAVVVENRGAMKMEGWDRRMMRRVPAGPDPLHHNGANPKKPRSP